MDYKAIADGIQRTGATQEWVFQVLHEGITSGKLPGGTQLKQDEISAALSVSHIPVREALRQLEAQGLVEIKANRGASVTKLTRSNVNDMMEVRATLSVMTLRNSAPHLTEEDYRELDAIMAEQAETTELFRCEELNYRFHNVLSRYNDNHVANLFMNLIHDNIDRYLRKNFYEDEKDRARSLGEHMGIVERLRAGDVDGACSLLHDHILNANSYIPDELEP